MSDAHAPHVSSSPFLRAIILLPVPLPDGGRRAQHVFGTKEVPVRRVAKVAE